MDPHLPIRIKQYPISLEGRKGLKPIVDRLFKKGTLEPCMSPHNTPILPVKKPDGSYRMMQDQRAVNQRTVTRFPVVANPYTLSSHLSPKHVWYSIIDVKDAFWTCSLDGTSRVIFAFEWEDPETGPKQQLTMDCFNSRIHGITKFIRAGPRENIAILHSSREY